MNDSLAELQSTIERERNRTCVCVCKHEEEYKKLAFIGILAEMFCFLLNYEQT